MPTRLYVHEQGANADTNEPTMVDLAGRPYSQLKVANLFRTKYNPACSCKPQPWEAASIERHHGYAVAAGLAKPRPVGRSEVATALEPPRNASPWIRSRVAFAQSRRAPVPGHHYPQSRVEVAVVDGIASDGRRVAVTPAASVAGASVSVASAPVVTYLSATAQPAAEAAEQNGVRVIMPPMGLGASKATTAKVYSGAPSRRSVFVDSAQGM